MLLLDANVLIDSHRPRSPADREKAQWVQTVFAGPEGIALPDAVLAAFLRISTDRRIFPDFTPLEDASAVVEQLLAHSNAHNLQPSPGFWPRMLTLCQESDARGPLISDAYLAALAIESGATLVTSDRGFARFPGLRWRRPGPG